MDLIGQSITQLRRLLIKGDVSPVDVAEAVANRMSTKDGEIGAYLASYAEEVIEHARVQTRNCDYKAKPLGGVPLAIKDNICIKNKVTTCGSRILEGYTSPYTATAVKKLEKAGALIAGKTSCDEFAMGSSNENCAYGPVKNPWDISRVPGGSSGGSAAAVASGMAFGALGSDTGGSIRQPAAFCGVVGLKPTYGRVSRYGLVAFASSLDQIGPITRTVDDAALLLGVISGIDSFDSTSLSAEVPDYTQDLDKGLAGKTISIPYDILDHTIEDGVRARFEEVVLLLKSGGVKICRVELPHLEHALAAYYIIAAAEASANLARYDGTMYGRRAVAPENLNRMYIRSRGEGFGNEVKRRILLGTYVLSAGYQDAYYIEAQKVRSLIINDFGRIFQSCHLILMPTTPTPAFRLGEKTDDPVEMYKNDIFTIPASMAGLPSISLPCGLAEGRLPVGVQLIGPALEEPLLLKAARGLERLIDFRESAIA